MEVEADRSDDDSSKAAIRRHMEMIAGMFGQGDFSLPMFIHDTVPPGVEVMKRLKAQLSYTAENTAQGAQVRISTRNPEALAAVHEFLLFQIKEHRTGDQTTVATGQQFKILTESLSRSSSETRTSTSSSLPLCVSK